MTPTRVTPHLKRTCNGVHTQSITFHTINATLYEMSVSCMRCDPSCSRLESQPTPPHLQLPSVQNQSLVFNPMTYTIGQPSNFNLSNHDFLFFCGPQIFGFTPLDAAHHSNIFSNLHNWDSCLTMNNILVFHPGGGGGYLSQLASPKTCNLSF